MRILCWITKATDTHSEYVILIALPLQQRLYERASMLVTRTLTVLLTDQNVHQPTQCGVHCETEYGDFPQRCLTFLGKMRVFL